MFLFVVVVVDGRGSGRDKYDWDDHVEEEPASDDDTI